MELIPSRKISLSGEVDIYDAIDTLVLGKTLDGAGHRLGTYAFIGDVNGDGLNDIALASTEDYSNQGYRGDGRIYIFHGNESGLPNIIDLDQREPDQVIMGDARYADDGYYLIQNWTLLGNQMEVGDFNNDNCTDIVVSIPANTSVRESAIIWGQQGGLPKNIIINVFDDYEPGYNITRLTAGNYSRERIPNYLDDQYDIIWDGGWGPHGNPRGCFGMDRDITTDFMQVHDLDKDGYDDLISGGFLTDDSGNLGSGLLPRVWTLSIYWGATGNKTMLFDEQDQSFMTKSFDIGDIDGDGELDACVGAPYMSKEWKGSEKQGAAFVIFNLSRFRFGDYIMDENFIPMNESYDGVIWGSGHNDWFGNLVKLHDINGDGMDEIFIGSPYADGPGDLNVNSGQIYMFKGRPKNGFTLNMDADNDADSIVFGDQGFVNGNPDIMGDTLGNRFEIADIDANGELEFIAGLPFKDLPDKDLRQRNRAGLVMVYKLTDLFRDDVRIVQISNNQGIYVLHGYDMEDTLGIQMLVDDVDNDGIDDIFLTSPMADGIDNNRPRCGEAYIVRGHGLVIGDLSITGPAVTGRDVFLGDGRVDLNLTFRNTLGWERIEQGRLIIDPDEMDLEIEFTKDGLYPNDKLDEALISNGIDINWRGSDEIGNIGMSMELGWDLITNAHLDVRVELRTEYNETIERTFENVMRFRNDVVMKGGTGLSVDGDPHPTPDRWFTPGEVLTVDPPEIVYRHDVSRIVENGPFNFQLLRNGTIVLDRIDHAVFDGLSTLVEDAGYFNLSLSIDPKIGQEYSWNYDMPDTGDPLKIRTIYVDNRAPEPPEDLRIISGSGVMNRSSNGVFELKWNDTIGKDMDHNESGVRSTLVLSNGKEIEPIGTGGFVGTYFQEYDFSEPVIQRIDSSIDFLDWDLWGPDTERMNPDLFSVRWNGYIDLEGEYDNYLKFTGHGQVNVYIDGVQILDWTSLDKDPVAGPIDSANGGKMSIEIYYRVQSGRSGMRMEYLANSGSYELAEEEMLYHITNKVSIEDDQNGSVTCQVLNVDWTGKRSNYVSATGIIDNTGPEITFIDNKPWYPDTDVAFSVNIHDGDPSVSSGIDGSSIFWRMQSESGSWSDWTNESMELPEEMDPAGTSPLEIFLEPEVNETWKGAVQVKAQDMLGNGAFSDAFWFGIDMEAPEISVLEPDSFSEIATSSLSFKISVSDLGGSGVNGSDIRLRYSRMGEEWSRWMNMSIDESTSGNERSYAFFDLSETYGWMRYQFQASDMVGNSVTSDEYTISITKPVEDLPPIPVIYKPSDSQVFYESDIIEFSAEGTSDDHVPDPADLEFTWISSMDGQIGTGLECSRSLSKGDHTITLYVWDGTPGNNVSTFIRITVKEKEPEPEDPGDDDNVGAKKDNNLIWIILIVLAVIILIGAVMYVISKRNRIEEQEETPAESSFQSREE